mgnify:CR=1 FL=1
MSEDRAVEKSLKESIEERLQLISEKVSTGFKTDNVRSLARNYVELDELSKKISADLEKIKKYLAKKNFKEEFDDLGKYVQNVEGRSQSHISILRLTQDFDTKDILAISSVTETALKKFISKNYSKEEVEERIARYKIDDGKGSPSIRVFKLKG